MLGSVRDHPDFKILIKSGITDKLIDRILDTYQTPRITESQLSSVADLFVLYMFFVKSGVAFSVERIERFFVLLTCNPHRVPPS